MKIKFSKMQGAGNDFIVIDAISQSIDLSVDDCKALADRHMGVGADQILLVEKATRSDADFRYRIFNADGSEVAQCGNGARAFTRFVFAKGLTNKRQLRIETMRGILEPILKADNRVTVNMGIPSFNPQDAGFVSENLVHRLQQQETLWQLAYTATDDKDHDSILELAILSIGNPHAVQLVSDVESAPVKTQGAWLEKNAHFLHRVNAGFMQILDRSHIKLRVFERGSGETLSCGSGACAAVMTGIRRGLLDSEVEVATRGGTLTIRWHGNQQQQDVPVFLTGPAVFVFDGEVELNHRHKVEPIK